MDDPTVPEPAPPEIKGLHERDLTDDDAGWLVAHLNAWLYGRWYPVCCRHCGAEHVLSRAPHRAPTWGPPYWWHCPRCDGTISPPSSATA